MTLSDVSNPGQIGPGAMDINGLLRIPESSSITGASLWDCLVSYLGHSLWESYPSAEIQ